MGHRRENGVDTLKLHHDTLFKTLKNIAWRQDANIARSWKREIDEYSEATF